MLFFWYGKGKKGKEQKRKEGTRVSDAEDLKHQQVR